MTLLRLLQLLGCSRGFLTWKSDTSNVTLIRGATESNVQHHFQRTIVATILLLHRGFNLQRGATTSYNPLEKSALSLFLIMAPFLRRLNSPTPLHVPGERINPPAPSREMSPGRRVPPAPSDLHFSDILSRRIKRREKGPCRSSDCRSRRWQVRDRAQGKPNEINRINLVENGLSSPSLWRTQRTVRSVHLVPCLQSVS